MLLGVRLERHMAVNALGLRPLLYLCEISYVGTRLECHQTVLHIWLKLPLNLFAEIGLNVFDP